MKQIVFLLGFFFLSLPVFAQTNTFPTSGNVGIGTLSPIEKLEIVNGNIMLDYNYKMYWDNLYNFLGAEAPGNEALKMVYGGSINMIIDSDNNSTSSSFSIKHNSLSAQSANSLFVVKENGNVGIGTSNPESLLHVLESSVGIKTTYSDVVIEHVDAQLDIVSSGDGSWGSAINLIEGNGSTNKDIWSIARQTTNGNGDSSLRFNFGTNNQHNNSAKFIISSSGNVGIGTINPDEKLTVKGKIHSEEVIVDLNVPGPDYVFEEDYDLTSLNELEAYIKANKHLPEIPSAAELETHGIVLGEMNMLLLKKIEELTLHLIDIQKQVDVLKKENEHLKTEKKQ